MQLNDIYLFISKLFSPCFLLLKASCLHWFLGFSECSSTNSKTRKKLISKNAVLLPSGLPPSYIPAKQFMWLHIELDWEHIHTKTYQKKEVGEIKEESIFNMNQFLELVLYAQMLVLAQGDGAEAKTKGRERPRCSRLECNIRRPSLSSLCLHFCCVNNL